MQLQLRNALRGGRRARIIYKKLYVRVYVRGCVRRQKRLT